jgi:hypothetical protein
MITLNSEQGLIDIESWEDVISRPGYVTDLDPSKHTLDSIIGRYVEKDMVKCGLTNCHSPHAKGYIVKTKEGLSTNIGKDCGKNYFGVDFETMAKQFERDLTMKNNRERLATFSFQLEELEQSLDNLRQGKGGADWVYKKSRPLITANNGCPDEVVRRLISMIKASTSILTLAREATPQEIAVLEVAQGRKIQQPHVIEDRISEILGLQVLYPENDLRNLLIIDIETNLIDFKLKNIDILDFKELAYWCKWFDALENKIANATATVKSGVELLTSTNLEPLNAILNDRNDKVLFRTYLKSLEN